MAFFLYKGLKKPLIFFGLKDKYIYYGIGIAVSGFVMVALLSIFINTWGFVIGASFSAVGIWLTYKRQDKKGLYNKQKNENEVHILKSRFKNFKHLNETK